MFKKRELLLCLVVLLLFFSIALVNAQKIVIQTPPVVAALPILWMDENNILGEGVELEVVISPDHNRAIALIADNEIDMMITGVNVGAKVFNKGINVKLLNTNTWAVDYLLTKGFKADSWQDLRGKTLNLPLKGGPLDFLTRYFLIKNGIAIEDVKLIYMPLVNGARSFQLGKLDAIILPEPQVTVTLTNTEDGYLSLDLQQEWAKFHDGDARIPFVGLFVSGRFAADNTEFTRQFNQFYQTGVDWVNSHQTEAANLGSKYFNLPAGIIQASFQRINLNCYPEEESFQLIEEYFREILNMYPDLIGGRLPNEYFYF
jgi:NitT/TauT family transport system substrate-binding protein